MATLDTAYKKAKELVKAFKESEKTFLAPGYSEAQVRDDFIDEFFAALGWDVIHTHEKNPHRQEVKIEKNVADEKKRKRRADYVFSLAPNYKNSIFIVEAKKPARDLLNADDYFQAIRYATNTNTPIVVLTDFEELHVIDARFKTTIDTALNRKIKEYRYHDYADKDKFAEIYYLFSREAVADNSIQEYADSLPIPTSKVALKTYLPKGTKSVDESLLDELEKIREILAKAFKKENPALDSYALTEATQRTIDRLVFMRFLEDKLLEPDLFVSRFARSKTPWKDFTHDCSRLNLKYNGVVFRKHFIDDSSFKSPAAKTFIEVCNRMTNPDYYYDVIPIHILGSIYERFLGKVVHATAKRVTVEEKPAVKKAGGVYYTPQYIVDYIIENTIGKLIEGKSPLQISRMRFADIACGSGSFLISAFGHILDYHSKWYNDNPKKAREDGCIYLKEDDKWVLSLKQKRQILVNNIYGVDIDEQAVEVTELSLYLKLLEDETTATAHEMSSLFTLLPDLSNNIICGNSLIEPDILLSNLFSGEKELKLNPMAFDNAFSEVMDKGGFDAVVGNPPYVAIDAIDVVQREYFATKFPQLVKRFDLFGLFIDKGVQIAKDKGYIGYIIPMQFLKNSAFAPLRESILKSNLIVEINAVGADVFEGANNDTIIFILSKTKKSSSKTRIRISEPNNNDLVLNREFTTSQSHYLKSNEYCFELISDSERRIIGKVEKVGKLIEDYFKVVQGIVTGLNPAFIFSKSELPSVDKKLLVDFLYGSNFDSYMLRAVNYKILYLNKDIDIKKFPLTKKYLLPFKDKLSKRREVERNLISWYSLQWPRKGSYFESPKIIFQKIRNQTLKRRLVGTYDDSGLYVGDGVIFLNSLTNNTSQLKMVLAILNSNLLNYYYRLKYLDINLKINYLNNTSIPDLTRDSEQLDKLVLLVDQIIETKKKLATTKMDKDKNYYERKCNNIDLEINNEVYKLYGLSKDDIEIINSD